MKRRFWPLPHDLRAILYTAPNQTTLIGLSSDGRFIWLLDTLEQNIELIVESTEQHDKFTCIRMKDPETILIGTFKGTLITKSLKTEKSDYDTRKISSNPITLIIDENFQVDSSGRLFYKNQIILNDEILQPCALLRSEKFIYFLKHRNIYIINKNNGNKEFNINTVKLEQNGYICAAELDFNGALYFCTDSGEVYYLEIETFKPKLLNSSNSSDSADVSDGSDEDEESSTKTEKILSLIQNPNNQSELLLLKIDPVNKRSWFDFFKIDVIEKPRSDPIVPELELILIKCPLCADNEIQSLKLNASFCFHGHPITICSQTKKLIESLNCFRCRACKAVYSEQPSFCQFCSNLITK